MSKIDASQIRNIVSGTGISENDHKSLRDLIHFLDDGPGDGFTSGSYKEITPIGSPFPTTVIWYQNDSKTKKIMEKNIVRNSKQMPIYIIYKVYSTDGINVLSSIQDSISYANNVFEISRVRTII